VENSRQLEQLADTGIDFSQGYLTGKPELPFDPAMP
jgi:EAL domain-containing protein (putative c-di-GMP-specific phosphodiesterase class I)